jgi:2,4-dienoyl-CoA reductase-like NADH-dependent reductase (Old Yellow Enzyme family)
MNYQRIAGLKTADDFRKHLNSIGANLLFDEQIQNGPDAPLAQPYVLKSGFSIGNRFAVHPMEGWDATLDGKPTDLTFRRWKNFGESGAKLIWGGEAVAVKPEGRANPNQLLMNKSNLPEIKKLRETLLGAHEARYHNTSDLLIGLQLTHSGRFSRPNQKTKLEPVIVYHHPYLDEKFGISPDYPIVTDEEIKQIIGHYISAAEMAYEAGYHFVDVKHCHGYLGHEFLSAFTRGGPYGGSFENRTRFMREIVTGINARVPKLKMGIRLSAFDQPPFKPSPDTRIGIPVELKYGTKFWFGANSTNPFEIDFTEIVQFIKMAEDLGVEMINISAGSPYYNPHIQRPALFPPSDGYLPPEDPLKGVALQIQATAQIKKYFPNMLIVGSAYSYLQEWLANVGQYYVRKKGADFIGLGRMILSYPDFSADVLAGRTLDRKRICRTFSDCTTAPRNGMVSGCYPLDHFYKAFPEAKKLAEIKAKIKTTISDSVKSCMKEK